MVRSSKIRADVAAFLLSHDDSVPTVTRDDALRMVAMLSWPISEPQLTRYLKKGVQDDGLETIEIGRSRSKSRLPLAGNDGRAGQLCRQVPQVKSGRGDVTPYITDHLLHPGQRNVAVLISF